MLHHTAIVGYGIVLFNIPLDTVQAISGNISTAKHLTGTKWTLNQNQTVTKLQHKHQNSSQPIHRVTGYNFPFHVHILCIQYGTVLADTAVISMRV